MDLRVKTVSFVEAQVSSRIERDHPGCSVLHPCGILSEKQEINRRGAENAEKNAERN
jgi:hypothetical protein